MLYIFLFIYLNCVEPATGDAGAKVIKDEQWLLQFLGSVN